MDKIKAFYDKIDMWIYEKIRNTKIYRFWWNLQHRFNPNHRYNVLHTGLPAGYYDLDMRILYAVMNNFKEFYEGNEHSFFQRNIDWNTHPEIVNATDEHSKLWFDHHRPMKLEMDIIYDWWIGYLDFQSMQEDYWEHCSTKDKSPQVHAQIQKDIFAREELLENEANDMLARLMKIRRTLWS